jgi:hypothetical protein
MKAKHFAIAGLVAVIAGKRSKTLTRPEDKTPAQYVSTMYF